MSVVGEFSVPAKSFILEQALSAVPEMTVEADRLATHSPMEVFPFLWATGGEFEAFKRALRDDPTTTDVSVAEETDEEVLYRLEWTPDVMDLIHEIVDHYASIVEATARDDQWHLRLRFADEEMVSEFQTYFREQGHEFQVHQLSRPRKPRQREYDLTEEQHEALVAAVRGGYFRIPRETSAEDIGETLDISANAVSQRLRRGTDAVLRRALTISHETIDGE